MPTARISSFLPRPTVVFLESGRLIARAAENAVERGPNGITVIAAAGNEGRQIVAPGCAHNVITVGAINDNNDGIQSNDTVWSESGHGPTFEGIVKPDLVAPGVSITALKKDAVPTDPLSLQYYDAGDGTSYAAPHVAGVAALLYEKNPTWTAAQIKAALKQTADLHNLGSDENMRGKGLVDAFDAINLSSGSINYAYAYAFDLPQFPASTTVTSHTNNGWGELVQAKMSKEPKGISVNQGLFGLQNQHKLFERMVFTDIKIGGASVYNSLTDTNLLAAPRFDKSQQSSVYVYATYKVGSETVQLAWFVGTNELSLASRMLAFSGPKTFEYTQYLDYDIRTTVDNDKATTWISPYTVYSTEQKFISSTVGCSCIAFNQRDNLPTDPWMLITLPTSSTHATTFTPTGWLLNWKSAEPPTNNPDNYYQLTESINPSGSGSNLVVYYRGTYSATSSVLYDGTTAHPRFTYPP